MKVLLGGVRGTSAVADSGYMEYGGDTTSFLIEGKEETMVVIDVGTGVRLVDARMREAATGKTCLLLMTHYHFDHIAGFPSFSVLYDPSWSLEIAAPQRNDFVVGEVVSSLLAKPFWPLQIDALQASIHFRTLKGERYEKPYTYEGLEIRWCPLHHMGECSAYRVDEPSTGASIVIATDVEWSESTPEEKVDLIDLCCDPSPAKCLVFDGHFGPRAYPRFRGWGHSTWQDGVEIAREAGVEQLVITHHSPDNDDSTLRALEENARAAFDGAFFGREGMTLELG